MKSIHAFVMQRTHNALSLALVIFNFLRDFFVYASVAFSDLLFFYSSSFALLVEGLIMRLLPPSMLLLLLYRAHMSIDLFA